MLNRPSQVGCRLVNSNSRVCVWQHHLKCRILTTSNQSCMQYCVKNKKSRRPVLTLEGIHLTIEWVSSKLSHKFSFLKRDLYHRTVSLLIRKKLLQLVQIINPRKTITQMIIVLPLANFLPLPTKTENNLNKSHPSNR